MQKTFYAVHDWLGSGSGSFKKSLQSLKNALLPKRKQENEQKKQQKKQQESANTLALLRDCKLRRTRFLKFLQTAKSLRCEGENQRKVLEQAMQGIREQMFAICSGREQPEDDMQLYTLVGRMDELDLLLKQNEEDHSVLDFIPGSDVDEFSHLTHNAMVHTTQFRSVRACIYHPTTINQPTHHYHEPTTIDHPTHHNHV